ncbi:copper resistance CopC family protein [Nostocoides sp. HKS02]|uniref:copper resistance CopC family protein n=1 Tax=Nostocoides sp. HKS02 TaxID=1813880 RepID=UPI0018A7FF5A|nr:copper resistance CopC family protein [Tetrasphaera sp. HKS02]
MSAWSLAVVAGATLVALGAATLTTASPASAHAVLRSTSPAAGASLATAPREVVLTFDEAPAAVGDVVRVTGPDGSVVSVGSARIVGTTVHQDLASGLASGGYEVVWRVTSDDGHPVSNAFAFDVTGPAMSTRTTPATPAASGGSQPSATPGVSAPAGQTSGASWPTLVAVALLVVVLVGLAAFVVRRRRAIGRRA